jgi:4-carboxymuconolactone decarboxylase
MQLDRLPPIPAAELTAEQAAAVETIANGPRGGLVGPFIPLLRSPELMTRVQRTGEFLRFESHLEPRLLEFAILVMARRWDQPFEWAYHVPLALDRGVPEAAIEAIAREKRPADLIAGEAVVWDVLEQLHTLKGLDDATYARGTQFLGEVQLVELVLAAGYYTMLAMVMNVARTPAPAHHGPALTPRSEL